MVCMYRIVVSAYFKVAISHLDFEQVIANAIEILWPRLILCIIYSSVCTCLQACVISPSNYHVCEYELIILAGFYCEVYQCFLK